MRPIARSPPTTNRPEAAIIPTRPPPPLRCCATAGATTMLPGSTLRMPGHQRFSNGDCGCSRATLGGSGTTPSWGFRRGTTGRATRCGGATRWGPWYIRCGGAWGGDRPTGGPAWAQPATDSAASAASGLNFMASGFLVSRMTSTTLRRVASMSGASRSRDRTQYRAPRRTVPTGSLVSPGIVGVIGCRRLGAAG